MTKKKYTIEELKNLSLLEFAEIFFPDIFKKAGHLHIIIDEAIPKDMVYLSQLDNPRGKILERKISEALCQGRNPLSQHSTKPH